MLTQRQPIRIETERMTLRPPVLSDFEGWAQLRDESRDFLIPWEPKWADNHLTRRGFMTRVTWAKNSIKSGSAIPLFLIRRTDNVLVGSITLDNIRRGPAQSGTIGYWVGEPYARQGYMREAIMAVVHHAFTHLGLSRIEAACLPENDASRGVLEKSGFKYEGVAQSYLEINGRWRNHVLYAALRMDRRGRAEPT